MQYPEEQYKVRRGNVSLRVTRNEVGKYYDMGYDVYTINGQLVKQAVPQDIPTLQKAFFDNQKRIAELEEEILELNEQLSELNFKKATAKKATKKSATD